MNEHYMWVEKYLDGYLYVGGSHYESSRAKKSNI